MPKFDLRGALRDFRGRNELLYAISLIAMSLREFSAAKLKSSIRWIIVTTLTLNLIYLCKDLSDDIAEGASLWHMVPEVFIVFITVLTSILGLLYLMKIKERSDVYKKRVGELETINTDWQKRTRAYSEGLAIEIDRQMDSWELSKAEKEIALLLLKGLSNKEIAEVRATSEQTIKQQSSAIYRKSKLNSRAELSAFFLEDLLVTKESI